MESTCNTSCDCLLCLWLPGAAVLLGGLLYAVRRKLTLGTPYQQVLYVSLPFAHRLAVVTSMLHAMSICKRLLPGARNPEVLQWLITAVTRLQIRICSNVCTSLGYR